MNTHGQFKLPHQVSAMMMTRRSFLEVTVSTVATGSLAALAGCGPSSSGTPANQKMTIEFWVWDTEKQWKEVERKSGLDKQFPNVTFKWTVLPFDQLHQKALTALGAGLPQGLPSIIRTSASYYHAFAATGNLTDALKKSLPIRKISSLLSGRVC